MKVNWEKYIGLLMIYMLLAVKYDIDIDLFSSIYIPLAICSHRPKLIKKGCDKNLLDQKTKSNAGYRSLAIIQGANTDILRLCQNKKEREDFSSQNKKTSMRTPS
ncbi:TPA: hypothetical protein VC087_001275 [Streptococcus pyogenes]|nr:hypothetical protein [Streptococcus pyogenes]